MRGFSVLLQRSYSLVYSVSPRFRNTVFAIINNGDTAIAYRYYTIILPYVRSTQQRVYVQCTLARIITLRSCEDVFALIRQIVRIQESRKLVTATDRKVPCRLCVGLPPAQQACRLVDQLKSHGEPSCLSLVVKHAGERREQHRSTSTGTSYIFACVYVHHPPRPSHRCCQGPSRPIRTVCVPHNLERK